MRNPNSFRHALALLGMLTGGAVVMGQGVTLERGFVHPPPEARLRAYWWWLNGNVTEAAITRDLEAMAAQGFGGALICDAGGAEQDGNDRVPHGPTFFSPEWRALYRHALREADRLGLEMSLNIQSGWNLGGPMVPAEDAPKKLVWSETTIQGPRSLARVLDRPKHAPAFYRDVAVVAYPVKVATEARRPLANWAQKAMHKALHFSAPVTTPLFEELPSVHGEEDAASGEIVDLTDRLEADGTLRWQVPAGEWQILRFGCTLNDHCRVSTCSDGWQGYALDPFDAGAFRRYWEAVVAPLIADAGPLAGRTLKYLHTDSWEVEVANWTPTLREEFRRRRGYDLLPFLPVIAGRIIDSRPVSNRFLDDFRKTMGDLAVDHHFRLFSDWAAAHGLRLHPESGGPHAVPVDSLRCLGINDAPMSEFWAWSWRHRVGDTNRFFVKQPASAAHTYGRRLVLAEGFTTIGPHWQETLWDNLKPAFDRALCEGLNRLVWHTFTCSPLEMGLPGQEYFAGTHFNPNATWWSRSGPFLAYLNRCQFMLQQGRFVADAVYYYGDHVPNFAQLKQSDPARVLPGYDYDVATEEVVLTRMEVSEGRIVLPDGMSYRVLVLPDRASISLPVLRKIRELVAAGATVMGPKPTRATGLRGFPACDQEVNRLADELWGEGDKPVPPRSRPFGSGRVLSGVTAREVLLADGVPPDFEFAGGAPGTALDYIHRATDEADIYFVANRSNRFEPVVCRFRVADRVPELWDPVTGGRRVLPAFERVGGRTMVPLEFTPFGSWFVVFGTNTGAATSIAGNRNFPVIEPRHELAGAWQVKFDRDQGGPGSVEFGQLRDWTEHHEPGVRHYSGTATYTKEFEPPPAILAGRLGNSERLLLDLGELRELAEVRLNGRELGILWCPPFRVDVTDVLKPGENTLEVDIVNFWPNRIIGDAALAPEERRTRTNIRKLTRDTPLVRSGLMGPVRLLKASGTAHQAAGMPAVVPP
jgi:hypothetical protein